MLRGYGTPKLHHKIIEFLSHFGNYGTDVWFVHIKEGIDMEISITGVATQSKVHSVFVRSEKRVKPGKELWKLFWTHDNVIYKWHGALSFKVLPYKVKRLAPHRPI